MDVIEVKDSWMRDMLQAFSNVTKKDDGKRWYTTVIWWDAPKKALIATNGSSLLWCNKKLLEHNMKDAGSGAYKYKNGFLLRDDVLSNETYVDYGKVIPNYSTYERWDFKALNVPKKYNMLSYMSQISAMSGHVFNPEYFEDCKGIISQFCSVYYKHDHRAVILTGLSEDIKLVIMPMHIGY